jgi:hypothetical protein
VSIDFRIRNCPWLGPGRSIWRRGDRRFGGCVFGSVEAGEVVERERWDDFHVSNNVQGGIV